jgi:GTP-binding protein EngB required for normal cell division
MSRVAEAVGADRLRQRLAALEHALGVAGDRLPAASLAGAREVLGRAEGRLAVTGGQTVAVLAGPTGSGKSSLFNVLAGAPLSPVGVRRPTTTQSVGCTWGEDDTLLGWLGVRAQFHPAPARDDVDLSGLVLVDLPDVDSIAAAHQAEADRVVGIADLLVWVVDPQKYADATLHTGYLRPLARHAGVTLVVLNHADALPPGGRQACADDLRRLLAADGLGDVPVVLTSAETGEGLETLRMALAERVRAGTAAAERLDGDVDLAARALARHVGPSDTGVRLGQASVHVQRGLAEAAGVPAIAEAAESAYRRRATLAVGWPPTRWLRRLRPGPLRRLGIGGGRAGAQPGAGPVGGARVRTAVDDLVERVTDGLPDPWPVQVRRVAAQPTVYLQESLGRELGRASVVLSKRPSWWAAAGMLQWALLLVAVAGAVWLVARAVASAYLQVSGFWLPRAGGVPIATLVLVGGLVAGLVLTMLLRGAVRWGARRRRRRAARTLQSAIDEVVERELLEPVRLEVEAYDAFRVQVTALLASSARDRHRS